MARYYDNFELRGLRDCLRSFDENGRYAHRGRWSIGRGGYDLQWELCYTDYSGYSQAFVHCISNRLEWVNGRMSEYPNAVKVIKTILSEYTWCKYYEERYVVTYTDYDCIYDDEVQTYSDECDDYQDAQRHIKFLKEEGITDIDYDVVYYDIDGNLIKR